MDKELEAKKKYIEKIIDWLEKDKQFYEKRVPTSKEQKLEYDTRVKVLESVIKPLKDFNMVDAVSPGGVFMTSDTKSGKILPIIKQSKLTEKQCLDMDGHCWNYHSGNDVVDEFGNITPHIRYLLHYSGQEPKFRTCRHCGKQEKEILGSWE